MSGAPAVLVISGLTVAYGHPDDPPVEAVTGVDLTIAPGEIHALVGESGAGKTTVGNALMGLLGASGRITAGEIHIGGRPVDTRTGRTEGITPGRDVGAIFQDPMTSLNPLFTVESQVAVGEGKMPVRAIFEALIQTRYPGFVDLEYEVHGDNPMPGVISSFAYMRGVLAGMGYREEG